MRAIWIAVTLLSAVLIGSTVMFIYSTVIYNDLQDILNSLYQAVEEENWEDADKIVANMEEVWNRADRSWTPVMDHRQVDRVDESMTRVVHLVNIRSKDDLMVEIPLSRRLLKRLKDTEVPDLQNVF